jgi:LuxR family quorum sensing-dependent transcriptional regulator
MDRITDRLSRAIVFVLVYLFPMSRTNPAVFDWIDGLEGLPSADEVWQSFLVFSRRYGFYYGAIVDLQNHRRTLDNVLSLTWPGPWRQRYATEKYLRRDPSVRALAYTCEPYTWMEGLEFDDYSRAERNIVFEASEYGLRGGFVVPIAGIRSGTAIVSVAGEQTDLSGRDRAQLHFAAIYAQTRIRTLTAAEKHAPAMRPHLSLRERECLEWAAMGKSDWEIGEILSISARTAGSHIERAKQKLGVATRIQAVVIALQHGSISV